MYSFVSNALDFPETTPLLLVTWGYISYPSEPLLPSWLHPWAQALFAWGPGNAGYSPATSWRGTTLILLSCYWSLQVIRRTGFTGFLIAGVCAVVPLSGSAHCFAVLWVFGRQWDVVRRICAASWEDHWPQIQGSLWTHVCSNHGNNCYKVSLSFVNTVLLSLK